MGDRRSLPLLPKSLLITIAGLGLALLALGLYLDFTNPAWLTSHPFTNNLLSSVVGFCAVTLVVGVGFTLIGERVSTLRLREKQLLETKKMVRQATSVASILDFRSESPRWVALEELATALRSGDERAISEVHGLAGNLVRFHADEIVPYADEYLREGSRVLTRSRMEEMDVTVAAMRREKASPELAVAVADYCTSLEKFTEDAYMESSRLHLLAQSGWPRRTR